MMNPRHLSLAAAAIAAGLAPLARADRIQKTDGSSIPDVSIVEENLQQVLYKSGSNQRQVPSEEVLFVEYERFPRMVDEAEAAAAEDDEREALRLLDGYLEEEIASPGERRKWAPPYAAWRTVQLRGKLADLEGLVAAASLLIKSFPESRYVPGAYLAKASAQEQLGQEGQAAKTLEALMALIGEKALAKRWELEGKLAQIRLDRSQVGGDKRDALAAVRREAGDSYPTVKSLALVAEGETYLQEAEKTGTSPERAAEQREEARKVFLDLVEDPRADDETLAAAYAGLGDCYFYAGAEPADEEKLRQAVLYYLRVVVSYPDQSRYVPKALFFSMRSFDLLRDSGRKSDMKRTLARLYPASPWAAEAEKFN